MTPLGYAVIFVITAVISYAIGRATESNTELELENQGLKSQCKEYKEEIEFNESQARSTKLKHELELTEVNHKNELAMEQKNFEIEHNNEKTVKKLEGQVNEKDTKIAVLEEKVTMLDKIVDLNADIVDVKDLIGTLIKKLPEININSLMLQGGSSESKK